MAESTKSLWALILGGSSGFGLATAQLLAQKGYNLFVVHRTPNAKMKALEGAFNLIKQYGVKLESINKNAVVPENADEIITFIKEKIGKQKIKLFLYSIADGNIKPLIKKADNQPLLLDDLNYTVHSMGLAFVMWSRKLFDEKLFCKKACILGFTTEWTSKVYNNYAAVAFGKGVLEASCRYLAIELAPYGIRTNLINAGISRTDALMAMPDAEATLSYTKKRNPFKRLTTPLDVANVVCLLADDAAGWINGEIIRVDGGEQIVF